MAHGQVFREINAVVEKRLESSIITASITDEYHDKEIGIPEDCIFDPFDGDRVKLFVVQASLQVYRIDPWEEMKTERGKITYLTKGFGVVDEEYIFYIREKTLNWDAQLGDKVECRIIEGKYIIGRNKYEYRCESIEKVDTKKDERKIDFIETAFQDLNLEENNFDAENVDSESEQGDNQRMEFEALQDAEPNKLFYDLPYGLYETLTSKNFKAIKNKLDSLVPRELNYNTYKRRFHALIALEEVEMKVSFDKYKCKTAWIDPEKNRDKNRFSVNCTKIHELRPPIAVGDKIEVRKKKNLKRWYRGNVERVMEDRFILKFRKDFIKDYNHGEEYSAEFFYSRTIFQRKHAAIDYAKKKLPEWFLFPSKMAEASKLQLRAVVSNGNLLINCKQVPWFNQSLNEEQKQSVAGALRGQCRPFPFIIFGPPGTGKTSTLIEIILQVSAHVKDARILVATQSNHAANVVSGRLIDNKPDIAVDLLRLVSNAVLDRRSLPKKLHRVSGSVLNTIIDDEDPFEYDQTPTDIKRNMQLQYLKKYKIIIGTCVGLGVLFGSEFSCGYFSHVLIDEAAQCNEAESLIPISFVNIKQGQVIMAGDPLQLPPITLSPHAKHYDLVKSMLERYIECYKNMEGVKLAESGYDPRLVTKLRLNYRALPNILEFYNKQFYQSQLISTICADTSVEANQLRDITRIFPKLGDGTNRNPFGICFVNVEGRNERMENRKSWENKEEAAIIKSFIPKILERKIAPEEIGVITPYYAQVVALGKELKHFKKVRVGTVEEFQGEEKKVIMISTVKTSGKDKALQFIYCPKRLNTAVSRARVFVIIFGKADLLSGDKNWVDLIEYSKDNESYFEGKDIVQML